MSHLKLEDLAILVVQPAPIEQPAPPATGVEHLQACPDCERKIARLRIIFEIAAADQTIAPPPVVLRQAIQIFQNRSATYA